MKNIKSAQSQQKKGQQN